MLVIQKILLQNPFFKKRIFFKQENKMLPPFYTHVKTDFSVFACKYLKEIID